MKIYTKRGDDGKTSTIGKKVYRKNAPLICALGDVDELGSFVGMAVCGCGTVDGQGDRREAGLAKVLVKVQGDLHKVGSELAGAVGAGGVGGAGGAGISNEDVVWIEGVIGEFWGGDDCPEGAVGFVKPGAKGELSARLHVCRSVCRRAERAVCAIRPARRVKLIIKYLNRLSDLLFVMGEC